jgi:anti-sigma factor RsiW
MGTEATDSDLPRLNALVDGELDPADRAVLASRIAADRDLARAHATLARLKATVGDLAEAAPAASPVVVRRRLAIPAAGAAAALALLAIFAVLAPNAWDEDGVAAPEHTVITLAALPAGLVVPDLGNAGLKLAGLAMETRGGLPAVLATYNGPRGCRLELRVRADDGTTVPAIAADRRVWAVNDLVYEFVSFGMPAERFAVISSAAERATRRGEAPGDGRVLREASTGWRPCLT